MAGVALKTTILRDAEVTAYGSNAPMLAWMDVVGGLRFWACGSRSAGAIILYRYRRSVLGPLWITASTAVMVVLYAELFRVNPRDFVPS